MDRFIIRVGEVKLAASDRELTVKEVDVSMAIAGAVHVSGLSTIID